MNFVSHKMLYILIVTMSTGFADKSEIFSCHAIKQSQIHTRILIFGFFRLALSGSMCTIWDLHVDGQTEKMIITNK